MNLDNQRTGVSLGALAFHQKSFSSHTQSVISLSVYYTRRSDNKHSKNTFQLLLKRATFHNFLQVRLGHQNILIDFSFPSISVLFT